MRKNKRTITGFLPYMLIVFMIITTIFGMDTTAFASGASTISVNVRDGVLTITGTGVVAASDANRWESDAAKITSVVVSDSITEIKSGAFSSLSALKTATIGNSVYNIENGAFPSHNFTMVGNYNPCARYVSNNKNVTLKMNKLRVLSIGNSHTGDSTRFADNIFSDLGLKDKISITVLAPMGGRKLFGETSRGSHYNSATTQSDSTYQAYANAFKNTWDVVVVQDYQESVVDGTKFADGMDMFVAWLRTTVPGADIGWSADWANYNSTYNSYTSSLAAIKAVNQKSNKPDFIIPASTLIENARTTYLGTTMNQQVNTHIDCDEDLTQLPLLHRDNTHMSKELGRQLASCNYAYTICKRYGLVNNVDAFFDGLKTKPVYYESEDEQWEGEFAPETWNVIRAIVKATEAAPYKVTDLSGTFGTDPIETVAQSIQKNVTDKITVPTTITKDSLKQAYTIKAIDSVKGNKDAIITDVAVNYTAAIDGTEEAPEGVDGAYSITAKLTYAYSVKMVTLCERTIKAKPVVNKTGWQVIDGKKYYYTADGVMQIGWKKIDSIWYYFGLDGAMTINKWVSYGGDWYYFDKNGAMTTNKWVSYKGDWYYFGANGVMATNKWVSYKGDWYYFGADGAMTTNKWVSYKGDWYYFGEDGAMLTSKWLSYKSKWYYFNSAGIMVTGKQTINGKTYNFNSSGVWINN